MRRAIALREHNEKGAYAILFAVLVVVLFIMIAFVVDLSDARARVRDNSTTADAAALAAGSLMISDPIGGCNAAWLYIKANLVGLPAGAVSPCDSGVDESFFARYTNNGGGCDPNTVRYYRSTNSDPFEVIFIYPVTDAVLLEQSASDRGVDLNFDGDNPCERFGVQVVSKQDALFGGIVGSVGIEAPATAISRSIIKGTHGRAVALLLLDPTGCDTLIASGQAEAWVFAHDAQNPGRITSDSDGLKASNPQTCEQGNDRYTLDAQGNQNSRIKACGSQFDPGNPSRCDPGGIIQLFAYRSGQSTCLPSAPGQHACDPNDLATNRLAPVPTRAPQRTTRAPADHEWDCKSTGYPIYAPYPPPAPQVPIPPCAAAADGMPAYITQLRTAINMTGNGAPTGFSSYNTWYQNNGVTGGGFNACRPAPGTIVPNGNWWVNCTGNQGFLVNIEATENVEFTGGNVVFQGNVTIQGGELKINTNNTTNATGYPDGCRRPNDLCPLAHSAKAAYIVFRNNGSLTKNAQAKLTWRHTAVYIHNGNINVGAGSPTLTWTAPHAIVHDNPATPSVDESRPGSPFDKMALWSESTTTHVLGGQAPLNIEGVYFTPNALFNYDGQANQFLDRAQFLTFRMNISGQGVLRMQPDPEFTLKTPDVDGWLIR